jgi:hypothetical protein
MINIYLRERELTLRVLGGVDSGAVFEFELFFTLLCHFGLFYRFSCLLLILRHFLLLDDLLEFFLTFSLLTVLHWVLDSNFKLCVFYYQWTHQGRD